MGALWCSALVHVLTRLRAPLHWRRWPMAGSGPGSSRALAMAAAHVTSLLYRVLSKYTLVDLSCGAAQSRCASGLPCSRICRLNTAATLGKHRPGLGQTRRPGSACNRLAGIANCKVCGKTRIVPGALGGDAPHRPASPGGWRPLDGCGARVIPPPCAPRAMARQFPGSGPPGWLVSRTAGKPRQTAMAHCEGSMPPRPGQREGRALDWSRSNGLGI